jgi:hypothetical protein
MWSAPPAAEKKNQAKGQEMARGASRPVEGYSSSIR